MHVHGVWAVAKSYLSSCHWPGDDVGKSVHFLHFAFFWAGTFQCSFVMRHYAIKHFSLNQKRTDSYTVAVNRRDTSPFLFFLKLRKYSCSCLQIREHHRKVRKEAKKRGRKKPKKDPGVPSAAPFKEQLLREAEQRKQRVKYSLW